MATITFQPVLRPVKDLLNTEFLEIPRFQRPYSWSIENLQDFFRDVIDDNDEGYFIGPMVGYNSPNGYTQLVDGQQRITSITLILCAIRDLFHSLGSTDSLAGITKYIERADDDDIAHYVLRSSAVGAFLHTQFQAPPSRTALPPRTDEERSLVKAFHEIKSSLEEKLDGLSNDRPSPDEQSPAILRLRNIRDRMLSLKVIWIRLDNEDDAYVVFETLNSRGKDLETVDLLKNHLLAKVRAENGDLDTARLTWTEMRANLEEHGGGVNANKFILHWWLSRHEYTAERKLFRLIRSRVTASNAATTVSQLKMDSTYYTRIVNPTAWTCQSHEQGARESLIALTIFGVSQPRPMLLALLRAYDEKSVRYKSIRRTLTAIENFHYVTTAIVGVSSTGGISEMYAKHARELTSASSTTARAGVLDQLIDKLTDPYRLPTRQSFISEFPRTLRFSEQETGDKRLVQYTLRKLHDATADGPLDHSKCNIEHLSPQQDDEAWMPEIGNLLWVDRNLNSALGAKPFAEKKAILSERSQAYDVADVLSAGTWGETEVRERSRRLAVLAYETVWRTAT